MRWNGVGEEFCSGDKSAWEKFQQWAYTVPYTLRNPLYHWTHLELQRYFDIHELLNPGSAESIYEACNEKLAAKEYSVISLLNKMNVRMVCTTDDPVDSLEHHRLIKERAIDFAVLPTFRPDAAMNFADAVRSLSYVKKLEAASGISIGSYNNYLDALKNRHDYFASMGCILSDHGLEMIDAGEFGVGEVEDAFNKVLAGKDLDAVAQRKLRSALLLQFAAWDHEKGWVQQFHLGAMRNNNSRMLRTLGPDTGWDSIGDFAQAAPLARFLDRLDSGNKLAKTILYNLDPSYNAIMATMAGNFNDGSFPGKVQWGAAWWFHDQKDGMTQQINTLSNMGLLSRFVGMITDSRSFLSYPRHEYFRRILCNILGHEMENGELPNDVEWIGEIVKDICFRNANNYFGLK